MIENINFLGEKKKLVKHATDARMETRRAYLGLSALGGKTIVRVRLIS